MGIEFKDDAHANSILELVRYATLDNQRALLEGDRRFIAEQPDIVRKIITVTPGSR